MSLRMRANERSRKSSLLDADACWTAVKRRDRAADGTFFYSVRTTGVYCRPSCAARLPRRENVAFHKTCADAARAGFRPCKRCRPNEPALAAMAGGIGLWRHAGHRLEHAVEVEAAHARGLRQRVEARRLLGFFDPPAGARDRGGMRLGKCGLVRPAALARPKSRPLGVGASFVEGHVLAPRQTSGA